MSFSNVGHTRFIQTFYQNDANPSQLPNTASSIELEEIQNGQAVDLPPLLTPHAAHATKRAGLCSTINKIICYVVPLFSIVFCIWDLVTTRMDRLAQTELLKNNFKHVPPKLLRDIYPTTYAISKTANEMLLFSQYPKDTFDPSTLTIESEDLFKNFTKGIYAYDPIIRLTHIEYNPDYLLRYHDQNPNNTFKYTHKPVGKENKFYLVTDFLDNKNGKKYVEQNYPIHVKAYACKADLEETSGKIDLDTSLDCSTVSFDTPQKEKEAFVQLLNDYYVDRAPYVSVITNT